MIQDTGAEGLEALFEQILRSLHLEAFELIIASGIRRAEDLLRVTGEDLRAAEGAPAAAVAEVLAARDRLEKLGTRRTAVVIHGVGSATEQHPPKERRLEQHIAFLGDLPPGKYARITLDKGERLDAVKRDLVLAAESLGRTVHCFETTSADTLIVQMHKVKSREPSSPKSSGAPPQRRVTHGSLQPERASDIPQQSLLRMSLIDMFEQTVRCRESLFDFFENKRVADLGLDEVDLRCLSRMAIFPEDDLTYILPLSLEYLVHSSVTANVFSALKNQLGEASLNQPGEVLALRRAALLQTPILAGIDVKPISDLPLENTILSCLVDPALRKSITTWSELAGLSEAALLGKAHLTLDAVKATHQLYHTRDTVLAILQDHAEWLQEEAYATYKQMIDSTLSTTLSNSRSRFIVRERMGLESGTRRTLADLAREVGLTREAVRQVEARLLPSFRKRAMVKLTRLWHVVLDFLGKSGGVLLVSEVSAELSKRWRWQEIPNETAMGSVLSINPVLQIVTGTSPSVLMQGNPCIECGRVKQGMSDLLRRSTGFIGLSVAAESLRQYCLLDEACPNVPPSFSTGFLYHAAHAIGGVTVGDDGVFSAEAWLLRHGSRSEAMRSILFHAGRSMHWSEVSDELRKCRPDEDILSERNVLSTLSRLDSLVLWGRGTFIHRAHIAPPVDLLKEIRDDVVSLLAQSIPFVSVGGLFSKHRKKLMAAGVPNATALYSCLRELRFPGLALSEYPYVMRKGEEAKRPSVAEALEKFVLDEDGVVSRRGLADFAVEKLLISSNLVPLHMSNVPGLLRLDKANYIHASQLSIEPHDLQPLLGHLDELLDTRDRVSVNKLFKDKRVSCRQLGVTTAQLLYSLLEAHSPQRYHFRFPTIGRRDSIESTERGISGEVVDYILSKRTICGLTELTRHFVSDLGYEQRNVYTGLNGQDILRYSQGTFVHIHALDWTQAGQETLERSALQHIKDREAIGKRFGLAHLLSEYHSLPTLPNGLCWTATLVGELLSREAHFRLLGPPKDAFVANPNPQGIATLADLLWVILNSEYNGVARLDVIVQDLITAGVLRKQLTEIMLGEDSRVVIRGQLVMTREASRLL